MVSICFVKRKANILLCLLGPKRHLSKEQKYKNREINIRVCQVFADLASAVCRACNGVLPNCQNFPLTTIIKNNLDFLAQLKSKWGLE